jgi:N6-adenosine-specific RNA methylase IME4
MTRLVQLPLTDIKVGRRHRKDLGDVAALARSIEETGLLHPIVVAADRTTLIAGQRRLEAFRHLGRDTIPAHVVPLADVVRGEYAENVIRKDFTASEAVDIARAIRPLEKEAAVERRRQHGGTAPGRRTNTSEKFTEGSRGETRTRVAGYVGRSWRTLEKAEAVVEAAEDDPAQFGPLVEEMDRTGKVDRAYGKLRRHVVHTERKSLALGESLGGQRFAVVYADPPWSYRNDSPTFPGAARSHYPTLTTDEICELPVAPQITTDAVLFLWATNPLLPDALRVVTAWGFTYKTNFCWTKPRMGTGFYNRGQHELLFVCTRGQFPPAPGSLVSSLLAAPQGRHSEKPVAVYGLIEAMYPGLRYLELFARATRQGWTAWGNEVPSAHATERKRPPAERSTGGDGERPRD